MEHAAPLVVDLDGTLLRSDLLLETGLLFVRDQPLRVLSPLFWLAGGKAALKHQLAHATDLDVTQLPYDPAVIALITRERAAGRRIVLATASHHRLAERVAAHLRLFDDVIASDVSRNLSAHAKRDALVDAYGEGGFDYAGNARDDLPVWQAARRAHVVNAPAAVRRQADALGNVTEVINSPAGGLRDWVAALRLHHWLKNLLIFVPLLVSHQFVAWPSVTHAIVAFVAFGLCASSVYILNDLLDLRDDRHHPRKRERPFAAGRLSIKAGLVALSLLLLVAFGLALLYLPATFTFGLAGYYGLTLSYSLWLKRHMVIDVITLAILYTLRIILGTLALDLPMSFWLLAFSMFIFLSLALIKRYAELYQLRDRSQGTKARGRGYFIDDLPMIASLGAAAGYMAVMVLALYINDAHSAQLYQQPQFFWLACPLLLVWMTRLWMLAHRGLVHEDPVIFTIRDRVSQGIALMLALVFWAAL